MTVREIGPYCNIVKGYAQIAGELRNIIAINISYWLILTLKCIILGHNANLLAKDNANHVFIQILGHPT